MQGMQLFRWGPGLFSQFSLRARVTLWITLIFLTIQVTLFLVVLLYIRQDTRSHVSESLDALVLAVREQAATWDTLPGRGDVEASLAPGLSTDLLDEYGLVLTAKASKGSTAAGPYGEQLLSLLPGLADRPGPADTLVDTGRAIVRTSIPVAMRNGGELTIAVSMTSRDADAALAMATRITLISIPISLLSLGVATWLVAGIAVRPLQEVEEFAAQLDPGNVGSPLGFESAGAEIESLHEQLSAAMGRIERAYEEQGRFLANIAHEIKTPISVVLAEAEVLLMKPSEPDDARRFVQSTAEEMRRLGSTVESFLLLTRVEEGEGRVRRSPIDLNDVLMQAIELCHGMAELHGVRLNPVLCDDELAPVVSGNADLLATAIGNLVRNAIRFSPKGEAVDVSCASEHLRVTVTVRDRGPGIPEDLVPRLFEPFTQASTERERGRGTGLGLQIAKGIAELHQGDIGVQNLDRGCAFRLDLPLHRAEAELR